MESTGSGDKRTGAAQGLRQNGEVVHLRGRNGRVDRERRMGHVVGFLVLQPSMFQEFGAGGDWALSWSALLFAAPTDPSPLASMSVQQQATGVAYLKDLSLVHAQRMKAKGTWTQLSKAPEEALEKWKRTNPGK